MILVEVVARVREHDLGVDARLEILEDLLHLGADVWQEAVAEPVHLDPCRAGAREEVGGARASLVGPRALRGEHDPVDLDLRMLADEAQDGPAAPDLDVVRMTADRKHPLERLGCRPTQHCGAVRP